MTRMLVARAGLGRLHIAAPMPGGGLATICGKALTGTVTTWRVGKQATAVWSEWPTCQSCVELERKWGR